MPFLTPKISRVSTSLCAGRLSFASEKGKFISGGSIFLLPHICALSALLGFVCVCVWVRGYVALLTQRKSQPCFIGFSTVQLVLLAVMRI